MAKILKTDNVNYLWKRQATETHSLVARMKNGKTMLENNVVTKLNVLHLATMLLGIYPNVLKLRSTQKLAHEYL